MARPPLALGTFGTIRYSGGGKSFRARCKYRDYDGITRDVERSGTTKAGAERALKAALRDRNHSDSTTEINRDTKLDVVAEAWWAGFAVAPGSPGTKRIYRDRLDVQILPALGNIRCRELSIGTVERFLRAVESNHGSSLTKTVRSVLSNICGYAARLDALDRNPVRDTSPISVKPKKGKAKSLTAAELKQLRALLTYDQQAIGRDLLDLVDLLSATGLRIGEALGLVWDAIDFEAGTVEVRGTVIRIKGEGLVIKPEPKSEAGYRTLILPSWAMDVLKSRLENYYKRPELVFRSVVGTLRDPSNVDHQLKDAFTKAGFPDITSHIFRKSVATLMDHAGLSARAAADQLGHSAVSLTQDTYFGRKVADTGAAGVLEALAF